MVVGQLRRGRQLDVENAVRRCDERIELAGDLRDLRGASLLGDESQEVDDELVRALRDVREYVRLHPRVDLGVLEKGSQVRCVHDRVTQLLHLCVHDRQLAAVFGGLEERLRVDAVRRAYDRLPSSSEKSISASASSIRRCWSGPVSDLRVIFSAATRLSLPTSSRI